MKRFNNFRLNENSTDDMLRVIDFLEIKNAELIEMNRKTGSEYGASITYNIINDFTLQYDFGWSDYEESDNDTVIIKFLKDGKIHISKINDGYSVMGDGNYSNSMEKTFDNMGGFMEWLIDELG